MIEKLLTTSCRGLAAGLMLVALQSSAQDQGQPSTFDQPPANMPPPAIPQPDELSQPTAAQPRADRPPVTDHPLDVGRYYSSDPTEMDDPPADRHAPPVPRDRDDANEYDANEYDVRDRADRRPSERAELGVYMLPTEGPGVRITRVYAGTAADIAGLQPGDYILRIDDRSVDGPFEVRDRIRERQTGDTVELTIWRNGGEQTITATLDPARRVTLDEGEFEDVLPQYVGRSFTYYRGPIARRYNAYYPGSYYYGAPYSYGYGYRNPYTTGYRGYGNGPGYGTYYGNPWGVGRRVGPLRYNW